MRRLSNNEFALAVVGLEMPTLRLLVVVTASLCRHA